MHPITYGDYPEMMKYMVGDRLPKFTEAQAELVKGSFDFIGINYYTAVYADDLTSYSTVNLSYTTDSRVNETSNIQVLILVKFAMNFQYYPLSSNFFVLLLSGEKNGIPIGQPVSAHFHKFSCIL